MKAFFFIWFLILLLVITSQSNKHVKYKTITLQKVINLGNYESQRLEITIEADTEDDDELYDMLSELCATVDDNLTRFKQQHEYMRKMEAEEKKTLDELPY